MGIEPPQTLYVGNDMLKDITPASRIGFRTALFAGDARSFRMRENDERVKDFQPDLVVTELTQLLQVLGVG
jgi:putative hydrolase of the HAD superfamily